MRIRSLALVLLLLSAASCDPAPAPGESPISLAPASAGAGDGRFVHAAAALSARESARVIVRLKDPELGAGESRRDGIARHRRRVLESLAPSGFSLARSYVAVPGFAGVLTRAGLDVLRASPEVVSVSLDMQGGGHLAQSVPALHGDRVVEYHGYSGEGIVVAVLDTGVDSENPDLEGAVIAEHCFNFDDNGPGQCPPDGTAEGDSALDENGHGTNVTGIIASRGVQGAVGFAPGAKVVAVRVLDQENRGYLSDWVAGLDWLLAHLDEQPIHIVNMSLGTDKLYPSSCDEDPDISLMAAALDQLVNAGVAVFASSGNQGASDRIASPACNTGAIAVGATYDSDLGREPDTGTYKEFFGDATVACVDAKTNLDTITCFTNSSPDLDIVAPGARIMAAADGDYYYSGTSQASPTAAAVAALALECDPTLSPAAIQSLMVKTGTPLTDPKNGLSFSRIDALAVVDACAAGFCAARPDGTPCNDGNPCTLDETCSGGACAAEVTDCPAKNECHEQGVCDSLSRTCKDVMKENGSPCDGGECRGGQCQKDSVPDPKDTDEKSDCHCRQASANGSPAGPGAAVLGALLLLLRRRPAHPERRAKARS